MKPTTVAVACLCLVLLTCTMVSGSTIYVLRCHTYTPFGTRMLQKYQNVKFYVGKTDREIDERLEEHADGHNPWTRGTECELIYMEEDKNISAFDPSQAEDIVFMWMVKKVGQITKYGLNVRGGLFTKPRLSMDDEKMIRRLIDHSRNACFKCSQTSHFAKECFRQQITVLDESYLKQIGARHWSGQDPEFPDVRSSKVDYDEEMKDVNVDNEVLPWKKSRHVRLGRNIARFEDALSLSKI